MALSFEESLALERQRLNLEALAASHQRAMEQMLIQQQRMVSSAWMCSKDRQRAESLWGIVACSQPICLWSSARK